MEKYSYILKLGLVNNSVKTLHEKQGNFQAMSSQNADRLTNSTEDGLNIINCEKRSNRFTGKLQY
jgi:hypothetical protein